MEPFSRLSFRDTGTQSSLNSQGQGVAGTMELHWGDILPCKQGSPWRFLEPGMLSPWLPVKQVMGSKEAAAHSS